MKEARYLVRIAHQRIFKPADQASLLAQVRMLAAPLKGKAINLRVSPGAMEFDLFCSPDAAADSFLSAFKSMGKILTCKRLDVAPPAVDAAALVTEATHLFNEHRFWEVHEVLEGLWKERKGEEKQLIQGLILIAAALVHAQKDEFAVVWTMMDDALKRLKGQPAAYYSWDIAKFQDHFARVLATKKLEFPTV